MLSFIEDLLAEKAGVSIIFRGLMLQQAAMPLQSLVQSFGVTGVMRVGPSHIELLLEGSKPRLERLAKAVSQASFITSASHVMEVGWTAYQRRYSSFRVGFATARL
ncbi:MAG TPA: hypothetical protein VMU17_06090 [Elusimicrobiota bacterium]|nr:hypothetical protein [Elusimicrobiota bacterium]